jgi:hypothetical protein
METAAAKALHFTGDELNLLTEILESEKARLTVEIRHTDKRLFREDLKHRLTLVDELLSHLSQ